MKFFENTTKAGSNLSALIHNFWAKFYENGHFDRAKPFIFAKSNGNLDSFNSRIWAAAKKDRTSWVTGY